MPAAVTEPAADPSRPHRLHWEDFPVGSVREFGAYRVTREEVLAFASAYDPQPFHLSDAAAESSLFGRLAASGWHTCAMTMRMLCDGYLLESASLGSPGIDNLRWHKPVYPGDTLRAYAVYVDERDKVWVSDFGDNAMLRFDPATERFERFGFPREATSIRQILGRPGEVWLPESGTEHISVIRTG